MHKTLAALANDWSPALNDVSQREGLLVEKFCYMSAVDSAKYKGLNIVPVDMDNEGLLAESLESVLENWDYSRGKRPHLIYTVSTGQNPTGGVVGLERRKQIYQVCSKFDVIIIEDEPYWFLQYPVSEEAPAAESVVESSSRRNLSSGYKFLDSLVQSYLEIDTDGRVVRLDTFSKNVAPGCRLGWITGQPAVVERILRIAEGSTQQPSGFVQSMIAKLVGAGETSNNNTTTTTTTSSWTYDGWVKWLEGLRDSYQNRMKQMCEVLDEGKIVVEHDDEHENEGWSKIRGPHEAYYHFEWPRAGMFVWIKLHLYDHPLATTNEFSIEELSTALWIWLTRKPNLILLSPGRLFCPSDEILEQSHLHFRLCFAAIAEEEIKSTTERIPVAINAFWKMDTQQVRELVESANDDANTNADALSSVRSVFGC